MHPRSSLLPLLLLLGACGGGGGATPPDADTTPPPDSAPPADAIADHGAIAPVASKLGNPVFDIVDWQLYAVPNGAGAQFIPKLLGVWTKHKDYPALNTLGPDEVHAPPYDTELTESVPAAGYTSGALWGVADWTVPNELLLSATIVPSATAPTGKSTDFASGPIIPETIWPLTVNANLKKGVGIIDPDFDSLYPAIDDVVPAAQADGYSHMPLNFGEDTSYIPGEPGEYSYEVFVTDQAGNGWKVVIPFTIQ